MASCPRHPRTVLATSTVLVLACATGRVPGARSDASPAPAHERSAATGISEGVESDPDAIDAFCAKPDSGCRRDVRIVLPLPDGGTFDRTYATFPPPLQAGFLTVLPGETLLVEAEARGEHLVFVRVVKEPEHPERTLRFEFGPQGEVAPGAMALAIRNPFARFVKFDVGVMWHDKEGVFATSSCPVAPRGGSFEIWPFPIFQLVVGRGRFVEPEGGSVRCD